MLKNSKILNYGEHLKEETKVFFKNLQDSAQDWSVQKWDMVVC